MKSHGNKIDDIKTEKAASHNFIMASVNNFTSAVIRIRDILRKTAISGMESMRHICLYLMARQITRQTALDLDVPIKFAWENIIEMMHTREGGEQYALEFFYHPEEDCLVRHFDRLFGTEKFSFDIKNLKTHKEILEILDKIDLYTIDSQMDILGWVYEQHLKTGAGSGSRDLGQFFTNRNICEYMVSLCRPSFKRAGVPESVCDPSMGTGGFLTSYIKYYKKHHSDTPINWKIQQKEIHGCDNDPRVAGIARMNLFMETGGNRPTNLRTHDSLHGDLTQTGYDVILANEPFGLKGLKHADCCERVKQLKIRGTKSEPLFLQLMMVSLNQGGRCAVVVPDGMLSNKAAFHNETRKYLLDHFELKRVIKMRGQFFMNTGIQPSILFFENTGNATPAVEFWDVVANANGSVEETMVLSVPRAAIDEACSLDMRSYQEVKEVAHSAGYPIMKLGEIIQKTGSGKTNSTSISNTGEYPFYGCTAVVPSGTHSSYDFDDAEYLLFAKSGGNAKNPISPSMGIGKFHYVKGHSSANVAVYQYKIKSDKMADITYPYLSHILRMNLHKFQALAKYTTGNGNIDVNDALDIMIPIPPLPIQQEIVATLDRIYQPGTTELADTLKLTNQAMDLVLAQPNGVTLEPIVEAQRLMRKSAQMVADVKAQMVADVKAQMVAIVKAIAHGCKTGTTIGNLYDTPSCKKKFNSGDMDNSGDIPFFNGKFNSPVGTHSDYSFDSEHEYFVMIKDGGGDHSSDSVGMGKFFNVKGKTAITSHNLILVPKTFNEALHKFMRIYLYCHGKEIRDKARYSLSLGSISVKDILNFPVPNMTADQLTNANIRLGALQTQLTSLENLGKQAEDNARFILESYLQSPTELPHSSEDVWNSHEETLANEVVEEASAIASATASATASASLPLKMKKPAVSKK